jgi:hypothetical protein
MRGLHSAQPAFPARKRSVSSTNSARNVTCGYSEILVAIDGLPFDLVINSTPQNRDSNVRYRKPISGSGQKHRKNIVRVTMKKIMIATAIAVALSGGVAFAQSGHPRYEHGSKYARSSSMNSQGGPTGWEYRMPGNNAELQGDNANSGAGPNSVNNNNNLGNGP